MPSLRELKLMVLESACILKVSLKIREGERDGEGELEKEKEKEILLYRRIHLIQFLAHINNFN